MFFPYQRFSKIKRAKIYIPVIIRINANIYENKIDNTIITFIGIFIFSGKSFLFSITSIENNNAQKILIR